MITLGTQLVIYRAGNYNSEDHLVISVTVEKNGYDIVSQADSFYDPTVTGSRCHMPLGFFSKSSEAIVEELKKNRIIPPYFAGQKIELIPDETEALYQFDQSPEGLKNNKQDVTTQPTPTVERKVRNIDELYKIIQLEDLDKSVLTAGGYGTISLYIDDNRRWHLIYNGERGPMAEYHNLTEEEACDRAYYAVRRSTEARRRLQRKQQHKPKPFI